MQGAADSKLSRARVASSEVVDLRFARITAVAIAAICVVLWLIGWQARGWISAWPRFVDDAYYYLVIARNAAAGHGFTMDRISPTNGFQPLWMWILVPIARVAGGDVNLLLLVVQGVCVAIFAVAGGLLCGVVRARIGLVPALVAGLLLFFPRIENASLSGMEAALFLLIFAALIIEALRSGALSNPEPRASDARTGALVGLLMLARLDSVFVGLTLAAWVGVQGLSGGEGTPAERLLRTARKGLVVFWPAVLLLVPYLAWNRLEFGHFVPISGSLKTSFPVPGFNPGHLNAEHVALLALALAGIGVETRRGASGDPLVKLLAVLSLGLVLHALHAVIFMRWGVLSWHFAGLIPAGIVGAALLTREIERKLSRSVVVAGMVGLTVLQILALASSISRLGYTFTIGAREAGEWVAENFPPDAVIGMKDSGIFSYFAQRRVMNLDGLANSFEFAEAVCSGRMQDFVLAHGVEFISQHAVPQNVRLGDYETYAQPYPCGLRGGPDGELVLRRELEVFRGTPYQSYVGRFEQLVIWRLDRAPAGEAPLDTGP
jgi:hypothetical protein